MDNCLLTKLKATVDNDSLFYLGKLKVSFDGQISNPRVCRFILMQGAKVTVLSGTIYSDSAATTPIVSPKEITGEGANMFVFYVKPTTPAVILIEDKYSLIYTVNRITSSETSARPVIDFEDLATCYGVKECSFFFMRTEGTLEHLIEIGCENWDGSVRTYTLYNSTVSGVTFHGSYVTSETNLYCKKESGVVNVYATKSGGTYSNIVATYTIATKTWQYNS